MKKLVIISSVACLTIFATVFMACNKSDMQSSSAQSASNTSIDKATRRSGSFTFEGKTYTVNNGVLEFYNIADYEAITNSEVYSRLTNFANSANNSNLFSTYYSTLTNTDNKSQFEFLGKIINNNGVVKIGEFLVMLDFTKKRVYAQSNGTLANLNLVKGGGTKVGVLTYDMGDDVIEELKIKKTRGLFCSDLFVNNFELGVSPTINTNLTSVQSTQGGNILFPVTITGGVKYWPAGIYFELNSRVIVLPAGNPLATAPFSYTTSYSCQRRCGNSFSGTDTRSFSLGISNDKNIMYWNVRALKKGVGFITTTITSSSSVPSGVSASVTRNL